METSKEKLNSQPVPNESNNLKELFVLHVDALNDPQTGLPSYEQKEYHIPAEMISMLFMGNIYELYVTDDETCFFLVMDGKGFKICYLSGKDGKDNLMYYLHELKIFGTKPAEFNYIYKSLYIVAKRDGTRIKQEPRAYMYKNTIYYDLYDLKNPRYIVIDKDGYDVKNSLNFCFKTHKTRLPQPDPKKGGSIGLLDDYLLMDSDMLLLMKIYILCAFIPEIEHPLLLIEGETASGKTTLSYILKKLIDPTSSEILRMPSKMDSLILNLFQHYFIAFDNLPTKISESISNLLCQAVTGISTEDRGFFTQDTIIELSFKRIILLNGIDVGALKPDLLRRILPIRLLKIDETNYKSSESIKNKFDTDRPKILGAIFDTLVKALDFISKMDTKVAEGMLGFEKYGYACAEAMAKGEGEKFLNIYKKIVEEQKNRAAEDNLFIHTIITFMSDREPWEGIIKTLRTDLLDFSDIHGYDYMKKTIIRDPKTLANDLRNNLVLLEKKGIIAKEKRTSEARNWIITNQNFQNQVNPTNPSSPDAIINEKTTKDQDIEKEDTSE